jgi:hypothetical protein
MKLRRLVMMCVLVLLALAMVVVPVAAKKNVATITFRMYDYNEVYTPPLGVPTGSIIFYYGVGDGTIADFVASDPTISLSGAQLHTEFQAPCHPTTGTCPVPGKFRIVDAADPQSGFEGNNNMRPWVDLVKWPNAGYWYFKGTGFGKYKHMSIEFSTYGWVPWPDRVFEGTISWS